MSKLPIHVFSVTYKRTQHDMPHTLTYERAAVTEHLARRVLLCELLREGKHVLKIEPETCGA